MSLRFFGQYLIENAVIRVEQLREALALMDRGRPRLEQLAVELGMLTRAEQQRLSREAEYTGYSFLELLQDEQMLTEAQLNELIGRRGDAEISVGAALVELGHLDSSALTLWMRRFGDEQRPYYETQIALPGALNRHRPARAVVGLFCRLLPGIAGISVDEGSLRAEPAPDIALPSAAILARGVVPLWLELRVEPELARTLSRGMAGDASLDPSPEDGEDAVRELLNVVVGNAVALLEEDGLHLSIIPPDPAGSAEVERTLELATSAGKAWLLMDPAPDPAPRHSELELVIDA